MVAISFDTLIITHSRYEFTKAILYALSKGKKKLNFVDSHYERIPISMDRIAFLPHC